jgi:hypothetical protein
MKYISKPETALHSKLTVAAAVRRALITNPKDVDVGKKMLLKTYNKLDGLREVGVPEALSHMLGFRDHYTDAVFRTLHTTHLLRYITVANQQASSPAEHEYTNRLDDETTHDSTIVKSSRGYTIVSAFDDYAYRGTNLASFCLYDYCSLVYKEKKEGGIEFSSDHPQHSSHRQFVRSSTVAIPNLLGRLLFVSRNSPDRKKVEDYYCLISALFLPWSSTYSLQTGATSWEQFYSVNAYKIPPRLMRHIENLDLLHKSKEESRIDALQQKTWANEDSDVEGADGSSDIIELIHDGNDDGRTEMSDMTIVADVFETTIESETDWYVREAVDAYCDSDYFSTSEHFSPYSVHYSSIPLKQLKKAVNHIEAQLTESTISDNLNTDDTITDPFVFLSDENKIEIAITSIVHEFTLNNEQALAFRILADQTLGRSRIGDQLLMGIFGEGGTGKSRLIDAIRGWFKALRRENELVVTATTGTAAFKIGGKTLHSSVGIPIEDGDYRTRVSNKKASEWRDRCFLIVDEVSMMDARIMSRLNDELGRIKTPDKLLGGINVLFFGDFLQLPAVSHYDLYIDKPKWRHGHDIWRSLNAVVTLRQQMRQADDPIFAAALRRLRLHVPTEEDIDLLNSRIGARVPDSSHVPIIVRRQRVRQAINQQKLVHTSKVSNLPIVHCVADIIKTNMSKHQIYKVKQDTRTLGDAILSVIPGAPLMITKNVNQVIGLVNGAIVEFYGFANTHAEPTDNIISLPEYIFVKVPSDRATFQIPGLPKNIVPIEPVSFKHKAGHGRYVILRQFPITLAYSITDFKCQGQTYDWFCVDIKKPNKGPASSMSPYVQLSRGRSLQHLSIMRPFDPDELRKPLSKELIAELEWQEEMARKTATLY